MLSLILLLFSSLISGEEEEQILKKFSVENLTISLERFSKIFTTNSLEDVKIRLRIKNYLDYMIKIENAFSNIEEIISEINKCSPGNVCFYQQEFNQQIEIIKHAQQNLFKLLEDGKKRQIKIVLENDQRKKIDEAKKRFEVLRNKINFQVRFNAFSRTGAFKLNFNPAAKL